jgi:ankyrin repeat protein
MTNDNRENTSLHFAAFIGHVRACEILVAAGSDLDAHDKM